MWAIKKNREIYDINSKLFFSSNVFPLVNSIRRNTVLNKVLF